MELRDIEEMARKSHEEIAEMEREMRKRTGAGRPRGTPTPALPLIRIYRDLTQTALARESGVSRITIVQLEGGGRASARSIANLARALDVPPEWLVRDFGNLEGKIEEDGAEEAE